MLSKEKKNNDPDEFFIFFHKSSIQLPADHLSNEIFLKRKTGESRKVEKGRPQFVLTTSNNCFVQ